MNFALLIRYVCVGIYLEQNKSTWTYLGHVNRPLLMLPLPLGVFYLYCLDFDADAQCVHSLRGGYNQRWWGHSCARSRVLMPSVAPGYEYLHYFLCPSMRTCAIPCTQTWVLVPSLVSRHKYLHCFLHLGQRTCAISSAQLVVLGSSLTFGHEYLCHILHHLLHPGMSNCTIS